MQCKSQKTINLVKMLLSKTTAEKRLRTNIYDMSEIQTHFSVNKAFERGLLSELANPHNYDLQFLLQPITRKTKGMRNFA
jgi:hypothetical protein